MAEDVASGPPPNRHARDENRKETGDRVYRIHVAADKPPQAGDWIQSASPIGAD